MLQVLLDMSVSARINGIIEKQSQLNNSNPLQKIRKRVIKEINDSRSRIIMNLNMYGASKNLDYSKTIEPNHY